MPSAEELLAADPQVLRDSGFSARKGQTLRELAQRFVDGRLSDDALSNMTDDEALDFLTKGCFQSEGEARLKVIRSKQSSGQLSTYFVGRMAHYRLRQAIQRELGDRFDLAQYHAAVLEPAAVPVKFLPELVRAQLGIAR